MSASRRSYMNSTDTATWVTALIAETAVVVHVLLRVLINDRYYTKVMSDSDKFLICPVVHVALISAQILLIFFCLSFKLDYFYGVIFLYNLFVYNFFAFTAYDTDLKYFLDRANEAPFICSSLALAKVFLISFCVCSSQFHYSSPTQFNSL